MDDIKAQARENSSVLCRIAPWDCSENQFGSSFLRNFIIGWFSNRTATSFDDVKAREKH